MTHRVQRVAELIRREVATILERNFSFGGCIATIHEVDVAADLKQCSIYVGVLGNTQTPDSVVKKLNDSRGHIQRDLYKRVILKNSPTLTFRVTNSAERGVHLVNIIDSLPQIPDEIPSDDDAAANKTSE